MYREQQNKTAASLEEFKTESILKIVIFICLCLTQQRKCKRKQSQTPSVTNIVCIFIGCCMGMFWNFDRSIFELMIIACQTMHSDLFHLCSVVFLLSNILLTEYFSFFKCLVLFLDLINIFYLHQVERNWT